MTIELRALTAADLNVADTILMAAYGGASRKQRLRSYLRLQPDGWILAHWDGTPAGVAGVTHYGPIAHIGLVAVQPSYQRRGIAMAMMQHLLRWAAERGDPVVQLEASPAGAPLYERLGFVDDEKTIGYRQDDCARRPPLSDRVSLLRASDIPALAAFDAPIFGADRTAVFELFLGEAPERAFVAREATGQISGYLFAQQATIGPWAARTAGDAEALLGAALQLAYEAGPFVLAPSSNADVSILLLQYGFSPNRSLRHLRLGGQGPIGRHALLYGLASLAIG
jgi:ribosomal protein S18 acetylase RimI-like enzyme